MARYLFALRPKWLLGHVIVLVLVVVFVNLGFWQLRRLHQRQAFNARILNNETLPTTDLSDLLSPDSSAGKVARNQGRIVRVAGHYEPKGSVVIMGQSVNQVPGVWLVTPLVLDDGSAILVNRGFIPNTGSLRAPPSGAAPPSGRVVVEGSIQPTEKPIEMERPDPLSDTPRTNFSRIDISQIQTQLSQDLFPAWLLISSQKPAYAGSVGLTPVPPPALGNGPHLSYTIQWFSFALVGILGYGALLWLKARDPGDKGADDGPEDGPDDGGGGGGGVGDDPDKVDPWPPTSSLSPPVEPSDDAPVGEPPAPVPVS